MGGITWPLVLADRRARRPGRSATRGSSYRGALSCITLNVCTAILYCTRSGARSQCSVANTSMTCFFQSVFFWVTLIYTHCMYTGLWHKALCEKWDIHKSGMWRLLQTPVGHPDIPLIDESLSMLDGIIKHVDTRTGEAKCAFVKHKLRYTHDDQVCSFCFLCMSLLWIYLSRLPKHHVLFVYCGA